MRAEAPPNIRVVIQQAFYPVVLYVSIQVQHTFSTMTLHHYQPLGASRGRIIFCSISATGSSPMRCVWLIFYNQPSTLIRIAKPSQVSLPLIILNLLVGFIEDGN